MLISLAVLRSIEPVYPALDDSIFAEYFQLSIGYLSPISYFVSRRRWDLGNLLGQADFLRE